MEFFKSGVTFLICSFTHFLLSTLFYEQLWVEQMKIGGSTSTPILLISPLCWTILATEFAISLILIVYGIYKSSKHNNDSGGCRATI
jgi:hypothetical protein